MLAFWSVCDMVILEEIILDFILATKIGTPIIGQIATLMGWIMDGIYRVLNLVGIQNLGLCIIIFSILIYLCMTPLQIKQQKFSKMTAVMQPEIQKIQKKYQGKKDTESQQRMNEETMAVYEKYGVSPTGSCLQLAIQMPILLALWQVIYRIPAYVGSVSAIFTDAVNKIVTVNGYTDIIQSFISDNKMTRVALVLEDGVAAKSSIIDFLYALSPSQWLKLGEISEFSGFTDVISKTAASIKPLQTFGVLNIADQPLTYLKDVLNGGSILVGIAALLVPILAWASQMLSIKMMPQAATGTEETNTMASSMKTMNTVMPLMSAVFCFTFPVGLGIYWIASAVVRTIQQIVINKQMDKIDVEELVAANQKKMEEKRAKKGLPPQKITSQAHQSVKYIDRKIDKGSSGTDEQSREQKLQESYQKASGAREGSITAKANMVRDFNERNKKK